MEGQAGCQCPPYYLRTVPGILKIVEIIFTILTFAISFGGWWNGDGGGWVEFTGIVCFITITIWLIFHLINFIPHFIVNYLVEFISYCVMTIMLMISGIVAAAAAGHYSDPWKSHIGACCFFAFAAMITCAIDAVFQFLEYRHGTSGTTTTTMTATTTTTTTSSASKVEY